MPFDLKQKLGPLPVYAWGGIIGVAVVGYMWYTQQKQDSAAAAPATPVDTTGMADSGLNSLNGSGFDTGTNEGLPTTDAALPTNVDWETKAVEYLTAHGMSGIGAQRAIEMYLNGQRLDYGPAQWVDKVIALFGLPPEGTADIPSSRSKSNSEPKPPAHKAPKPKPKPKPKAPEPKPKPPVIHKKQTTHHDPGPAHNRKVPVHHTPPKPKPKTPHTEYLHYTIKRGDTLSALAHRFYGSATRANEEKIAHANGIHNLNLIYAGHTLRIPKD